MQRKSKRVVNSSIIQNKFDKSTFTEKLSNRRNDLSVLEIRIRISKLQGVINNQENTWF